MEPLLAYERRGTGTQPLLLLHGFLGAGRNLASLARRLCEAVPTVEAILPDLSGHGASAAAPAQGSLDSVAQALQRLVQHLGLPTPLTVMGHSMGGRVALQMLQSVPEVVGKVVFIDIPPGPLQPSAGGVGKLFSRLLAAPATLSSREAMRQYFLEDGNSAALTDWLLMNFVPRDGAFAWRFDRTWLNAYRKAFAYVDLWPLVQTHAQRLHCVVGGSSDYLQPTDLERLAQLQVPTHTIVGAGHFVHVDQQATLVDHLATLL
jgi:esterase